MDPIPESPQPVKKWVPRPMTHTCGVCGAPAADVCHYGSTACYSCRAFFRRSIGIGKEFVKCSRDTDSCVIDQVNRTNCKKCRFEKCLQNGMKPEKVGKKGNKTKKTLKSNHQTKNNLANWQVSTSPTETNYSTSSSPNSIASQEENFGEFSNEKYEGKRDEDESRQNIIDISALAENCVLEEIEQVERHKIISTANIETKPDPHSYCSLTSFMSPVLELTFEEEFKIHELDAIKENLIDGCFKTITSEIPNFIKKLSLALIAKSLGLFPAMSSEQVLTMQNRVRNCIKNLLFNGGKLHNFLDCYYVFKNVPHEVKMETFKFSLSVADLCFKAFFKVNSNKESFMEQRKAAGILGPTFQHFVDQILPNNRNSLKSVDHYAPEIFKSPWATQKSDEDLFNQTLKTVGDVVKDDVKLGTLYVTLVLATPGEELSQEAKTNTALVQVQQEITLLIYRYLKTKYNDADIASHTLNKMLKLIQDLHTCRAIHLFGRVQLTGQDQLHMSGQDLLHMSCQDQLHMSGQGQLHTNGQDQQPMSGQYHSQDYSNSLNMDIPL